MEKEKRDVPCDPLVFAIILNSSLHKLSTPQGIYSRFNIETIYLNFLTINKFST